MTAKGTCGIIVELELGEKGDDTVQQARMLGYRVQKYADAKKITASALSDRIHCTENQMKAFLKGRAFVSFDQLSTIADTLGVPVISLLNGEEKSYNENVVHCMNAFDHPENREKILDIIDEYMDLLDSLS